MFLEVAIFSLLIVLARVADVSLGVLRLACLVRGLSAPAVSLGFFEALVWVFAVTKVTAHLDQPIYMLAYAGGFAIGNYVGIEIDRRIAFGSQVVRIFTRRGVEMGKMFRESGLKVTTFRGEGKDGEIDLLLLKCPRRDVRGVLAKAYGLDEKSFSIVDDVTESNALQRRVMREAKRRWFSIFRR